MAAVDRADDEITEGGPENAEDRGSDDPFTLAPLAPIEEPTQAVAAPRPTRPKPTKKRREKPVIDLDDHIRKAQEAIKIARKQVQQARVQAKLEKRKKQRLVRRPSSPNVEDLERIAVLKRCGLASSSAPTGGSVAAASSAATAQPSSASNHQEQVPA